MPPVPYLRDSRAIVTRPINQAHPEETAAASIVSLLQYLDRPSTGAEVGRYERFFFRVLFLGTVIFWSTFKKEGRNEYTFPLIYYLHSTITGYNV